MSVKQSLVTGYWQLHGKQLYHLKFHTVELCRNISMQVNKQYTNNNNNNNNPKKNKQINQNKNNNNNIHTHTHKIKPQQTKTTTTATTKSYLLQQSYLLLINRSLTNTEEECKDMLQFYYENLESKTSATSQLSSLSRRL